MEPAGSSLENLGYQQERRGALSVWDLVVFMGTDLAVRRVRPSFRHLMSPLAGFAVIGYVLYEMVS